MFPFSKKPPSKVEVVKQGVSDAAQAFLHAIPAEKIEDKFDELKKTAAQVALQAAQVAHHAGEVASHKIDELQHAASHLNTDGAAAKAQAAKESAQASALAAREALQNHAATLKDSASALQATVQSTWRDRAAREAAHAQDEADEAKTEVKEAHGEAKEAAKFEAQAARAAAKAAAENAAKHEAEIEAKQHLEAAQLKAQEAKEKAKLEARQRAEAEAEAAKIEAEQRKADKIEAKEKAKEKALADKQKLEVAAAAAAALASKANDAKDAAAKHGVKIETKNRDLKLKAGDVHVAELDLRPGEDGDVEIEYADSASKWGWILVGVAAGVILALLFAPTSGRRSRAAIKDRLGKVGDGAADAATAASDKIGDIANRVEGLAHTVETKLAADVSSDDDSTIADRVRSVLGHHEVARTIDRLNIDCAEGVVTLRGPLLDAPTQETIIAAVKAVPGVKDVIAEFLTDEKPADPSTSVI